MEGGRGSAYSNNELNVLHGVPLNQPNLVVPVAEPPVHNGYPVMGWVSQPAAPGIEMGEDGWFSGMADHSVNAQRSEEMPVVPDLAFFEQAAMDTMAIANGHIATGVPVPQAVAYTGDIDLISAAYDDEDGMQEVPVHNGASSGDTVPYSEQQRSMGAPQSSLAAREVVIDLPANVQAGRFLPFHGFPNTIPAGDPVLQPQAPAPAQLVAQVPYIPPETAVPPLAIWSETIIRPSPMMISHATAPRDPNFVNWPANNVPGNVNINVSVSSPIGSTSGVSQLPPGWFGYQQPNMAELLHAQRVAEPANPYDAVTQGNYLPVLSPAAAQAQEIFEASVRGGAARSIQFQVPRSGQMQEEGQHSGSSSEPPAVQSTALTRSQRTNRLVSEIRSTLALVPRHGSLQFEDVMLLRQFRMFHVAGDQSDGEHEDMRLDIDSMTYEELLSLEEQIGNVSTGLSEDTIMANLRHCIYQPLTAVPPVESEPCCICREEYVAGEDLGKLDCGHDFHVQCITRWLIENNNCPVCRKTAVN